MRSVFALAALAALAGCSAPVLLNDTSAADEVIPSKTRQGKAYVQINTDLVNYKKEVKPGARCGAWSYPVELGAALKTSIVKTVQGAYDPVIVVDQASSPLSDGPLFSFRLSDYNARLRFVPGFFQPTAESSVEFAMSVSARTSTGTEYYSTTVRGTGMADEEGACPVGAAAVGRATEKALRGSLENFVSKVINTEHPGAKSKSPTQ